MKTVERRLTVGYARSAFKDDLAVEEQKNQIVEYCRNIGWGVDKAFIDNGRSGASLNRPALQELLKEVSKGNVTNVICTDRDRLSRSRSNYLTLMSLFKKHEVVMTFLTDIANKDVYSKFLEERLTNIKKLQSQVRFLRREIKNLGK
jgi:DNA invertase Pin-like site-specific DNA recombinase